MKKVTFLLRTVALAWVSLGLVASAVAAPGQRGGAPSAPNQPNAPPAPPPNRTQPPTAQPVPNQPADTTSTPANETPIFLMGNVVLSDGTPPPPNVQVRLLCGTGSIRTQTYADTRGNFSLMLSNQNNPGANSIIDVEQEPARSLDQSQGRGLGILFGCELKAALGGYQSTSIILNRQSPLDDPNVGTIYLHRLGEPGEAEGYIVSLTTKLAPKDARREYEKGIASQKKEQLADAEQEFQKAVTIYPKYAVAWYELGRVYQKQKRDDDALHAHQQAIAIEPKFLGPYAELTTIAFRQQKWPEVEKYTAQLIKLAPFAAPEVFFYNAAANYNLQQIDAAEKSARAAARLDPKHKVPRINYLLGFILERKQDLQGAAENLRLYLQYSPNATDAAAVQAELAGIEK